MGGAYTIIAGNNYALPVIYDMPMFDIEVKVYHKNISNNSTYHTALPDDVWCLFYVYNQNHQNGITNWIIANDGSYYEPVLSNDFENASTFWVKIASGTQIGDNINTPYKFRLTRSYIDKYDVAQFCGKLSKYTNIGSNKQLNFIDDFWNMYYYSGETLEYNSVPGCPPGCTSWNAQYLGGYSDGCRLHLQGVSLERPEEHMLYYANGVKKITSKNELLNIIDDTFNNLLPSNSEYINILQGTDGTPYTINWYQQKMRSSQGVTKGLYFSTSINRGSYGKIFNYGETTVNSRIDKHIFGVAYSNDGKWVTSKNGTTNATYKTNGAYYKANSYITYFTYGNITNSGPARVEISNSGGVVPSSQTIVAYMNTTGPMEFPKVDSYSDSLSAVSYQYAFSSLKSYFGGYLISKPESETYIDNEKYKGTYVFDFNDTNYISRFRYSIGTNVGWTTQRFNDTFKWVLRPVSDTDSNYFTFTFGSLKASSAGTNERLTWFYLFGVPSGTKVYCNDTLVGYSTNNGAPSWHKNYSWGGAIYESVETYGTAPPNIGLDYKSKVSFSNSGGGWTISNISFTSSIPLYNSTQKKITITQYKDTWSANKRYLTCYSSDNTRFDAYYTGGAPTGLEQTLDFDVYALIKCFHGGNKDEEIWCTRLYNPNKSGGAFPIYVSWPDKYKYKFIRA